MCGGGGGGGGSTVSLVFCFGPKLWFWTRDLDQAERKVQGGHQILALFIVILVLSRKSMFFSQNVAYTFF